MNNNISLEIVICTEKGNLEDMSKLLVFTIRELGGWMKNIPIYSYSPRGGRKISTSTKQFFERMHVEIVDENLNTEFINYPLANKPIVCSHRESKSISEQILFLDSDIFFLREPENFLLDDNSSISMRPVDQKGIGAENRYSGENGDYWEKLHKISGANDYRLVQTTVDNSEIIEYYNSGMVITKRSHGLFSEWLKNFEMAMSQQLMPPSGISFVEQSVLSATVTASQLDITPLGKENNCPFHLIRESENLEYRIDKIRDISSFHYHKVFRNKKGLNPLHDEIISTPNGKYIQELLVEYGIIQRNSRFNSYRNKIKRILFGK